jgi:hypothetical protein
VSLLLRHQKPLHQVTRISRSKTERGSLSSATPDTRPIYSDLAQKTPELKNFLDGEIEKAVHQRDKAFLEENETERAMCGQLMLATTVMLSANIVMLSNGEILKSMTFDQKWLTLLGVLSLGVSIAAGLQYYMVLVGFHKMWGFANSARAKLLSEAKFRSFGEMETMENVIFKPTQGKTTPEPRWLNVQKWALKIALIAYFVLLQAVLFDWRWVTSNLPLMLK